MLLFWLCVSPWKFRKKVSKGKKVTTGLTKQAWKLFKCQPSKQDVNVSKQVHRTFSSSNFPSSLKQRQQPFCHQDGRWMTNWSLSRLWTAMLFPFSFNNFILPFFLLLDFVCTKGRLLVFKFCQEVLAWQGSQAGNLPAWFGFPIPSFTIQLLTQSASSVRSLSSVKNIIITHICSEWKPILRFNMGLTAERLGNQNLWILNGQLSRKESVRRNTCWRSGI